MPRARGSTTDLPVVLRKVSKREGERMPILDEQPEPSAAQIEEWKDQLEEQAEHGHPAWDVVVPPDDV